MAKDSNSINSTHYALYNALYNAAKVHIEAHVLPLLAGTSTSNAAVDPMLANRSLTDNVSFSSAFTSYFPIWCSVLQSIMATGQAKEAKNAKNNTETRAVIMVCPNDEQARLAFQIVDSFNKAYNNRHTNYQQQIAFLPTWGAAIGTPISQYAPIRGERAAALFAISRQPVDLLICSVEQWNQLQVPRNTLVSTVLSIALHEEFDPIVISETLSSWSFVRVPRVNNEGEFALRGEVLDIYISKNTNGMNIDAAVRVVFDFGMVESIKLFDVQTQLSTRALEFVNIHPRSEFVWNDTLISKTSARLHSRFPEIGTAALEKTVAQIQTYGHDEWDYLYAAYAHEHTEHIIEYFDTPPLVLHANFEMLSKLEELYWTIHKDLFFNMGAVHAVPRFSRIKDMLSEKLKDKRPIPVYRTNNSRTSIAIGDTENNKFAGNLSYFSKYARNKLQVATLQTTLYIASEENSHLARLKVLLEGASASNTASINVSAYADAEIINEASTVQSGYDQNKDTQHTIKYVLVDLPSGFILNEEGIELYSETDLLGKKLHHFDSDKSTPIEFIQQIEQDDLVVHIQYGIGKFIQLTRMSLQGMEKDYIQLLYANEEKLYIPIEQMNMIQRYVGQSKDKVSLDSIGGKAWEKKKQIASEKIEDMSKELLEVHARRSTMTGHKFLSVEEWEKKFLDAFPHEETADQNTAWEEISADMERARPMDRLLVGDVGFGKTELAFRAAFRAIHSGKQVAFLAPTTILAEQHYYSALERFEDFAVHIGILSRLVSTKTQKQTIAKLAEGKIDLLIGTHKIIQKDIIYKDLGLCIIDEEHRFGVKDKEKIKRYRESVDFLALSATPIPRTLYQSIIQLRDMSLLSIPPKKRLPIRTFVEKFDENLVSKAIIAELDRGGQVFYLHNRIASLDEVQRFIEQLVPQATVLTVNGQMDAKQLEDNMYRFVHKGANVLVSTTIIENGIDIPNVNTIIIDRADNYGVAQLYQLRGRVGRSDQIAYAYLLYPDELAISELALKRLSTISDNSELGAGFQIAMRDMEVRGSGNLLGKEQSGSIFAIGYEHYIRLLDEKMKSLKGMPAPAAEPVLDIRYTGFIPDTYITDRSTKMELYKQIVSVNTLDEYNKIVTNTEDKYGHMPQEVKNLFWISKLRILCTSLYISSLKETPTSLELSFSQLSKVPQKNITTLIKEGKIRISKHSPHVLCIPLEKDKYISLEDKYNLLNECLSTIIASEA